MATPKLASRRSDAVSNVARIVEAARRLFATGDGTGPLSRIAREAGVGVATLYRHFPSRESLASAVYAHVFATEIEPALSTLGRNGVSREALLDVAERISDVVAHEPGLVAAMSRMTEVTGDLLRPRMETMAPILRASQEAGNIREDITPEDLPVLIALVATAFGSTRLDPPARRRYLGLLLDALSPSHIVPTAARRGCPTSTESPA
ncbi:TetR family transcriptional regulator [Knoellia koreensis]|uniref:TetR/AcrR family transcriptional regulator n=1 Tax=Knoellia koreensis TaxID=2730921 RepID=A0A849HDE1_9MICO|nr:TetR/AcrR family transcriptional regulator [Knoellia sp. DB2414S]